MKLNHKRSKLAGLAAAALAVSALVVPSAKSQLSGIKIDGSSTVYPITQAMAEEFAGESAINRAIRITIGISGTGGGFKKFCAKETHISGASRPIKQSEIDKCKAAGVEFIELPVAYDAITVVVSKKNTWATDMTPEELKKLWISDSSVDSWDDIRAGWPQEPVRLYGPGTDSGTYDYFVEAILGKNDAGKKNSPRTDYTASEDDNVLVQGVKDDETALGYFGLAYYAENADKLNAVAINGVLPSANTVNNGTYTPLSRPIYIYVNKEAASRPDIQAFVNYYLNGTKRNDIISEVGYVPLPGEDYTNAWQRYEDRQTGRVALREGL